MSTSFKVRTKAPSKCILSGEHSNIFGHPLVVMALAQYTTVEGHYWKDQQKGVVSLRFNINGKETLMEDTKSGFEQGLKPLLMNLVKIEEIIPIIKQHFPEEVAEFATAFALTLNIFTKYTSFFSIGGFMDALTSFKGEIKITADVPQEAGMGSSASFFSALILNMYVDHSSLGWHEESD